jgi:hypothetical protein
MLSKIKNTKGIKLMVHIIIMVQYIRVIMMIDDFKRRFVKNNYGLTLERYEELKQRALEIKEEEDIQQHLHGEITPTNPESIAIECYIGGYSKGKSETLEWIAKEMGVWDKLQKKREENRSLHYKRLNRRIYADVMNDHIWEKDWISSFFDTVYKEDMK